MTNPSVDENISSEKNEENNLSEIEKLNKKVDDMANQFSALMAVLSKNNAATDPIANKPKENKPKIASKPVRQPIPKKERELDAENVIAKEIPANQYVKVVSLCNGELNLRTKPYSNPNANRFSFQRFGEIKGIPYSQLIEIVENHRNFFEKGFFYIFDRDVILANGWGELYSKLLSKEQMEKIIENSDDAVKLFDSANDSQREVIINFLVGKIVKGEQVDYNLITNLSRISKVDIVGRAQDNQENKDFLENEREKDAKKNGPQ